MPRPSTRTRTSTTPGTSSRARWQSSVATRPRSWAPATGCRCHGASLTGSRVIGDREARILLVHDNATFRDFVRALAASGRVTCRAAHATDPGDPRAHEGRGRARPHGARRADDARGSRGDPQPGGRCVFPIARPSARGLTLTALPAVRAMFVVDAGVAGSVGCSTRFRGTGTR